MWLLLFNKCNLCCASISIPLFLRNDDLVLRHVCEGHQLGVVSTVINHSGTGKSRVVDDGRFGIAALAVLWR